MKYKLIILLFIYLVSCKPRQVPIKVTEEPSILTLDQKTFSYEDFPNEDLAFFNLIIKEHTRDGRSRIGKVTDGYKEGKWLTYIYSDKKEEYFKKGLRDSIFRQFDCNGKIIYETTFKMGTGLWKEFHANGKLYFEIETQDGYFIDTLKLYNDKGKLAEKLLYKKDSLIFREKIIFDENPTDNKN